MRVLLNRNRFFFSKDLFLNGSNPIRERVMSTPAWPVPYYQRLTKAYPIRGTRDPIQNSQSLTLAALTFQLMTLPGCPLSTC